MRQPGHWFTFPWGHSSACPSREINSSDRVPRQLSSSRVLSVTKSTGRGGIEQYDVVVTFGLVISIDIQ